ncbi:iron complex outermembrane receptor protein [Sphingobium xenophagum]|uniref:Iron complex outermembrane receptor protein n=1 Tax=Sphingobium xenophagum TaxID=121428 RepID=A0ABU1WZT0_SPHXE|nr:TonB-dependent siderophore receptor [Sphingobium xenophagum]MDR7154821.1 iron complex outermembrane receptor protein [Sphingobium xenophagum]
MSVRRNYVLPLLVSLPLIATPALADDTAGAVLIQEGAETAARDDAIIVLGTREQGYRATVAPQTNKSDTPLKETPFSVQVVTRELIQDRGITTVGEALRYVPGFSPQVGFGATNDRFYIRGFITPYNLKNGLRRSAYAPDEQLQNVEQVEVLKGAASALYGRFEPGGVVNFVTKKPLGTPFLEVGALYGSFDQLRLTLDASTPITDTLGLRINVSHDDRDGFRDFTFTRDTFVAPVLQWRPDADTTVTLEGEYAWKHGYFDRGFANDAIFLEAPRKRQFGEADARYDNKGGVASLFVDHRFSDAISGRVAVGYSDFTKDSFYYAFGFPPIDASDPDRPLVNRRPSLAYDRQKDLTAQAELYARFSTGAVEHKALVGVEYGYDHWRYNVVNPPFGVNIPIDFYAPVYGQRATPTVLTSDGEWNSDTTAIYAQDEAKIGQFRLLAGLRYDWNELESRNTLLAGPNESTKRGAASPRVGLTWTPSEAISLYGSWSRSFRAQVDVGRLRDGSLPKPLIGESFEAGIKTSLLGGRLTPTLALFNIERRNVAVSDPEDFDLVIQIGKSRSRGIEVDVPAVISPRWRVIANYTYLDATILEDSFATPGARLVNAPEHSASLWTTYDLAGPLDGASIGVGAQHIGKRAGNTDNTIFLPAYTRVDANLAYMFDAGFGPMRAQVNVLNLFDTFYYDSGGAFLPLYPGAPRTVTASLSYRFGGKR